MTTLLTADVSGSGPAVLSVERVAVVGAGSWGTTVAALLAPVVPTVLWSRRPEVAADVAAGRGNRRYLDGYDLPAGLEATDDLLAAVDGADLVVVGVPTHGFRSTLGAAASAIGVDVPVVSLAKGFEQGTGLRMTQVAAEVLPDRPVGVLTGPNLAREILEGRAAATVVAATEPSTSLAFQELLASDRLRVYTNDDLVGCEIGGAIKNVIALAAGMAEGLCRGQCTGRRRHPGSRRDDPSGGGPRRRLPDARRTGRAGRRSGHLHEWTEPQSMGRGAGRARCVA
ncbi:MAG: hypothetical protein Ct9H300mP12_02260 [Acidimicrobiales bacterium]|nr:MAG: hypothetical protein Ct9H300mP12_02260 [Acidimicrobiales bacterium]